MNIVAISRLLLELEKEFKVDSWVIDNIHIWPLIRMDLYMSLYYAQFGKIDTDINLMLKIREGTKMLLGIPKYVFAYHKDYKKNSKPTTFYDVVFLGDGVSKVYLKDAWFDKFCDPFIAYFKNQHTKTFLLDPSYQYIVPRYASSMFIQPFLDYELISSMAFKKRKSLNNVNLEGFVNFIDLIKSKNLNIPIPDLVRVKQIAFIVRSYANFFKKILLRTKPALGFVVGYYGPRGMAFNLACRELGIPSVDIQHGVQGEYQAAYSVWSKIPKTGYELLPSIFWCWSDREAEVLKKWANGSILKWHMPLVGGNLLFDFWQKGANGLTRYYDQIVEKNKSSINILVALSSVENQTTVLFQKLVPIMKKSPSNWKWWIRIHPCKLHKKSPIRKKLEQEKIANFELDLATDLPLYALLPYMSLHITYASATIIEAENFAVPSVIIGRSDAQYFSNQISEGIAVVASTERQIKNAILHLLKTKLIRKRKRVAENRQAKALAFLSNIL